jgi:hypothetical protein
MNPSTGSSAHKWSVGGDLVRPAVKQARPVRPQRYAVISGNVPPELPVTPLGNKPSVFGLRLRCRPCAVLRRIPRIDVNSFNRKIVPITVVGGPIVESGKAVPLLANPDAAPSVVRKLRVRGTVASTAHELPNAMQSRVGKSVGFVLFGNAGRPDTPARCGLPFAKVLTGDSSRLPTRTKATPERRAFKGVSGLSLDEPKTKSLTSQINQAGVFHAPNIS